MTDTSHLKELTDITKECIVLCVEDDEFVRGFLDEVLTGLFNKVIFAGNGKEGLDTFGSNRIDLVITDYVMPHMNGLDMVKDIRKASPRVPVIFITGHADTAILTDAINLGITQFLSKPIRYDSLLNSLEVAVQSVMVENMKSTSEKLELLKYKEEYHSLQQRMALRKQQSFVRDDLYYKKLDTANSKGEKSTYLVNVRYQPFDVLSGDFYAVRRIDNDKILVNITDATGKGLSAFVTTSIAASFANHAIDKGMARKDFTFKAFIDDYMTFARKQLLDDEALCGIFILLDFKAALMDVANFSMPPIFMEMEGDHIVTIAPNNLPIMPCDAPPAIDSYEISGIRKLLLCSDGFYSADYRPYVESDLRDSPFKNILNDRFNERIPFPDDDITFFFLRKFDARSQWIKDFVIKSRLSEVVRLNSEIESFLTLSQFETIFITEFVTAFLELLMNAYEHGSLDIGFRSKQQLVRKGSYEEHLASLEVNIDKDIRVSISSFEENGMTFLKATVADEGKGFDTTIIKESVRDIELLHYRGIKIVKGLVDDIYFNEKGNEVTFFKMCPS